MSRYIDAEWLLNRYREVQFRDGMTEGVVRFLVEENIRNAPSIDIVRCKECKSRGFYLEDADMYICNACDQLAFDPMHFCSYGERRDDE